MTRATLVAFDILSYSVPAFSSDVWRDKGPAQRTSEEVQRLLTKSPWAKEAAGDINMQRTGMPPERVGGGGGRGGWGGGGGAGGGGGGGGRSGRRGDADGSWSPPQIAPARIENVEAPTGRISVCLFPRTKALRPGDKEVVFETARGPIAIRCKFTLKEMTFRGKLEL